MDCPEPNLQPFIFEPTHDAAELNKITLKSYDNHLGKAIGDHPGSHISYGSEFRPLSQLVPLLSCHRYWNKFSDLLTSGSRYALQQRKDSDRSLDLAFFHDYRNHKSASTSTGAQLAMDLITGDVAMRRALPIPIDYIDTIIGSELCPLGIAKQYTISPEGEIIEKHRACHDHTFAGPSQSSMNLRTIKDQLEPCQYGHCLRRIVNYIVHLRHQHPTTPILMCKVDLDAAYRRVHTFWSFAAQCIVIIGTLAYMLLRLPFGAAAAPAEFCIVSEMVCDVANALMQDPTWETDSTHTPFHPMLPPISLLDESIPFAAAAPLDVQFPPANFDCMTDVYIDDLISLGVATPQIIPRIMTAVIVAVHCIFRPLHPSESSVRATVVSLRKMSGEGQLAETKTVLGWLLNTRLLTISLPSTKHVAWTSEIQRLLAQGFTTKSDLETLVGRLNHIGYILPLARHFLHRIRSLLSSPWHRHTKAIPPAQQDDLKLWVTILSSAAAGISLNLLCYRQPDVTCWSDACLTGIGGYDSTGHAWRWEIPFECRGRLTLNGLEYLASIITIHLFLSSTNLHFPCILSLLDNTSAIGWLYKSSFDTDSHSIHSTLARHLTTMMMDHQACLYSQHIPGETNVIADSLSRDFHIDTDTLTSLILSNFQVHPSFTLYPLTEDLNCWLTSLMLSRPKLRESKPEHTPSATWHGIDGSNISTTSTSFTTPTLTDSNPSTASMSYAHLCTPYERAASAKDPTLSKPAPPERPSTTWLRNTNQLFDPIPAPTSPGTSPSY